MERLFLEQGSKKRYWESASRILVAVSTGVDSMVLLDLLQKAQAESDFYLAVAHVNHQLREASKQEEFFLRAYCKEHQLPLFVKKWESLPTSGMESAARKFRYEFFQSIMQDHYFDTLMTAHHADDQLETMLMKVIRDGQLQSAGGIRERQAFAGGKLIRPLLGFSKEELIHYAKKRELVFYEDETNQLLDYQRNRLRNEVVPLLKRENPQILAHFQQLSEQLYLAEDLIVHQQKNWYQQAVSENEGGFQVDLEKFYLLNEGGKYFAIKYLLQQVRNQHQLIFSEEQLRNILDLLHQEKAQWQLNLTGNWQVLKEYQVLKIQNEPGEQALQVHQVRLGESLFLSDKEWLALIPNNEKVNLPEKVKNWAEIRQPLPVNFPKEVIVRKRKSGDRIQLTPALRKKISRVLIDKKVPNQLRERTWLMENSQTGILALLPGAFSYLSIGQETDKIHYILLYRYQE